MAIQKAAELAELIYSEVHNTMGPRSAADLIRADRRAVIEECRKVLTNPDMRNSWDYDGLFECSSGRWLDLNVILSALDSLLRELD
jgi:hypothetical protein